MSVELIYKHQRETHKNMKEQLERTHKAGYTYPTGCGKTFPILRLLEENKDKRLLVLAPRVEILEQYKEYIQKYIINDSKKTVKSVFENWHFITYQSLKKFNIQDTKVDIIVSDELHRTGAEEWGKQYDELLENNPEAYKIGITATPKRTDGQNMLNTYFGNDIVYELTLEEALSGDKTGEVIINPSRYVRVISELMPVLEEYRKKLNDITDEKEKLRLLKRFETIENTIKAADGLTDTFKKAMTKKDGKYIVFCKDEKDIKEVLEKAKEWFGAVNQEIQIDYVYSGTNDKELRKTQKQNALTMQEFKNPSEENEGKLKILICIDKLNEGVHIPGISGAIMLRPTESAIVYKQQLGRILTADKSAEETVMIDVANNWLRFKEAYFEYTRGLERGEKRRQGNISDKEYRSYRSYDLISEELELLDLIREIEGKRNERKIPELLRITEILKNNGVRIEEIQLSKRIDKHTMHSFLLSEIEQEGINISKIIEENGLNGNFPFGRIVKELRKGYRGTRKDIMITEEEYKRAKELGLIDIERKDVKKTLEISRILRDNGVNLQNIQLSRRKVSNEGLIYREYFALSEIEQEGIDIKKIIKEYGLDGSFQYTKMIITLKNHYRDGTDYLSDSEKNALENLGIINIELENDKRHPYMKLLDEIRLWQLDNNTTNLPKSGKISNLKKYIKKLSEKESLLDEEKAIIEEAKKIGITGEKARHSYLILLDEIQIWQEKNETSELPNARERERNMKPKERSEEYGLGKRLENLKNTFLKRYGTISDEEFFKLPEEIQEILVRCGQMGIGIKKYALIEKLKNYAEIHVVTNEETRTELFKKVQQYRESYIDKGETKND